MSDVNPNSRSSFVDANGRLTKYGIDVINKLYRALNFTGSSSAIDDSFGVTAFASSKPESNIIYEVVTSNYQAHYSAFLEAVSPVAITLNAEPLDGEQLVIYHNSSGNVTVTDGSATDILVNQGSVISYRYLIDAGGWVRGA